MTHKQDLNDNITKFVISGVAFAFCLVWALIGEADIKIVAVAIAFMCFLKYGIAVEMSSIEANGSH